jgi:integrase
MKLVQRENGVWYILFRRGKKKSLKTTDADEAQARFNIWLREALDGKIQEIDGVRRITLGKFRDKYEAARKAYAKDTLRGDKLAFGKLVGAFGEGLLLTSITREKVERWEANLLENVSLGSVKTWRGHLRAAFSQAIEWGYLRQNPFVGKKRGPYGSMDEGGATEPDLPPPYVDEEAFGRILLKEPDETYRRAYSVLFRTGMRRRELVRMKWEQVGESTLSIIGKGGRVRYFPLSDEIRGLLGNAGKPKQYVFPWRDANTITHRFKKAAVAAGFAEDVTPHTLRHAFISRLAMSGAEIADRQALVGHTSARMNLYYTHLQQEYLRRKVEGK